jgi:PAT family beta-lactamase induction signal transducer AmpG
MVIWVAGTMFKDLGHSDGEITMATASIGIAWSLKPLWAAFLDMYRTKKFFVLSMQFAMAVIFALIGLVLPLPSSFRTVIALLWVLAFLSATQDICTDGIYITALDERRQATWIGVQGMAWNAGRIFATAAVVGWAAARKATGIAASTAWASGLALSAALMLVLGTYHFFLLPSGSPSTRPMSTREIGSQLLDSVRAFFGKKSIWGMLGFVFLYRAGEGFLLVEAPLFLQASLRDGGAGLSLTDKSLIDGTLSTVVSIFGGLLGGAFVSRFGLKRSLVLLAFFLNVPHFCYVYLSQAVTPEAPLSFSAIALLVSLEKFGYSFGFVGNMLYMMQVVAPGRYKMTHYAFCTALMNLVLVPTQMASGPLAEWLGYKTFFLFVMFASVPSIVAAWLAPFPDSPDAETPANEGAAQPLNPAAS